jgi:hypothetical protein
MTLKKTAAIFIFCSLRSSLVAAHLQKTKIAIVFSGFSPLTKKIRNRWGLVKKANKTG